MLSQMFDCSQGYEGMICGTCSGSESNTSTVHYGKSASLDCKACKTNLWQAIYAILYIAVQVVLVLLFVTNVKNAPIFTCFVDPQSTTSDEEGIPLNPAAIIKVQLCVNLWLLNKMNIYIYIYISSFLGIRHVDDLD